jgi:hypothetical protein
MVTGRYPASVESHMPGFGAALAEKAHSMERPRAVAYLAVADILWVKWVDFRIGIHRVV